MKVGRKKKWEEGGTRELEEKKGFLSSFLIVFLILNNAKKKRRKYVSVTYLRIATVMASGEVAQGQITSGFSPWD